jgi:hypothetical protein
MDMACNLATTLFLIAGAMVAWGFGYVAGVAVGEVKGYADCERELELYVEEELRR